MTFGQRLRQLRNERRFTLRQLAEQVGVDFTYLSKIENERFAYTPSADTIRDLARVLNADSLELLTLANKLPNELKPLNANVQARRFFDRAKDIASPEDWDALLDLLEQRQTTRAAERPKRHRKDD